MPLSLRLHIGHHFFGSGNLGDDLMLAGFIDGVRLGAGASEAAITCASPFADAQRGRFPDVEWVPYEHPARAAAIEAADAWVGVGGTPFQLVVGTWFLDHLADELTMCRRAGKPMFLIGVGVNERAALDHPAARAVLDYASHVWTRDTQSAEWIAAICGDRRVTAAADLAHVAMRCRAFRKPEPGVSGYVLNFEDAVQFRADALCELVATTAGEQRWLVQEVRELPGSERAILSALPADCRHRLDVRCPEYSAATLHGLLDPWGVPERVLTSRYHAAVVGAWMRSRVLAVTRSDKVRGLVEQLGLRGVPALDDAGAVRDAWDASEPVAEDTLHQAAVKAQASCVALMCAVEAMRPEPREPSPPVDQRPSPVASNRAAFASLDEMNSPLFRSFMSMMNAFAATHGLRTFMNWTKIWEYPWLWHAGLSRVPWRGARVVDLGSEISPMPWFLATLGASVRLIEVDPQWVPAWESLRAKLGVDVEWHIVRDERIPLPDAEADVVTSFSVIEHQPDKRGAVADVARVLRRGAVFAVSFDVCEPARGMTFPEWNGRALTVQEFEDDLWLHPAFGNDTRPDWDWDRVQPFLEWHRTTAPHHNYVAGAAVLVKR